MIYLAFLFLLLFTGFFVRETIVSLRRGSVRNRGRSYGREDRPVSFWFGIASWILNASAGAVATVLLALSKLG
ncbi:hypothetical protein HZY97_09055 [Sphingomonas sp. R-74633]|uniref:hypothetical protein n=1 Tax=Sphingomonas sp. R-74633 TaxID=2751188 RepID=UPI0015D30DD5|nr:hypothetical protein [Sphingomonas sp. R-74633]NYT40901.1 hypothetical protein [Sphingomonas sp. R-74633]